MIFLLKKWYFIYKEEKKLKQTHPKFQAHAQGIIFNYIIVASMTLFQ